MHVLRNVLIAALVSASASAQSPDRVGLADLVDEALRVNPEIAAAANRYDAARQRPTQERSLPDPMVSAGYSASGNPLPGAGLGREPTANIGVMMSQELPYPGKRDLRASIASREADAQLQEISAARLNIVARVKQAYWTALEEATSAAALRVSSRKRRPSSAPSRRRGRRTPCSVSGGAVSGSRSPRSR